MKVIFVSVYYLQSNGTVARANGIIFSSINKMHVQSEKGKWVDELSKVV